jgi:hypothetical protein
MNSSDEPIRLQVHPRSSEPVTLSIPLSTLAQIRRIAEERDMTVEALLKLYIGQGLRQDISISSRSG